MNTSINDFVTVLSTITLIVLSCTSVVYLLLKGINIFLKRIKQNRLALLKDYDFPTSCYAAVQQRYLQLTAEQIELAFEQLRLFFEVCLMYSSPSSSIPVAMPSKIVDSCWHAFICETREYQDFCKSMFGDFLHHDSKPDTSFRLVDLSVNDIKNDKNTTAQIEDQSQQTRDLTNQLSVARIFHWTLAIGASRNSSSVVNIPVMFSIDQDLDIEDGYFYTPEVLKFLANFNLEVAESLVANRQPESAGGSAAACGDGGSCGGCGGSV
jgi:hypothetical protein